MYSKLMDSSKKKRSEENHVLVYRKDWMVLQWKRGLGYFLSCHSPHLTADTIPEYTTKRYIPLEHTITLAFIYMSVCSYLYNLVYIHNIYCICMYMVVGDLATDCQTDAQQITNYPNDHKYLHIRI